MIQSELKSISKLGLIFASKLLKSRVIVSGLVMVEMGNGVGGCWWKEFVGGFVLRGLERERR